MTDRTIVVGLGEVGAPLLRVLDRTHEVVGVDLEPVEVDWQPDVLHLCCPFEIDDFIGEASRYIQKYGPALTIINSTVVPGTTRAVAERAGVPVVHSPVRGKHARMEEELLKYDKFVGAADPADAQRAAAHFNEAGMSTRILSSPETTELAKLTETTYFAVLIAWAQEVERFGLQLDVDYDEVVSFYEEVGFFPPVKYFPGVIGGHCVMPNIELLQTIFDSELLTAIRGSNDRRAARE